MASIWKKRGSWYVGFRRPGAPKREVKCLGAISANEAELIRRELETSLLRAGASRLAPGVATFKDAIEGFLAEKRSRREVRTVRTYVTHTNHFVRLLDVNARIGAIDAAAISTYLDTRRTEGAKPPTLNKERTTLSTLFRWLIRRRLADRNPVDGVEPFSHRPEPPEPCSAELHEEIRAELLKEARAKERGNEKHIRVLVADLHEVLWQTGWRIGEACELRVDRVDEHAKAVRLVSAWNKGPAATPVPQAAWTILKRWLAAARAIESEYVFHAFHGQNALRAIELFWRRWVARHPAHRAGNFHRLRHAYASELEKAGVDPRTSQALTRHRTQAMLAHYSHRGLDELRAAQAQVEASRRRSKKKRRPRR